MFSVSYIKGCWRCAGTQFVLVRMHCKTPNILWPLICIKFKGNKGMICSFSTIKSYFQSEFYSALTCSGASSWPGTGLCNLSCLCYDLCPFAALLFVPLPRSYSNKLLSSSVSFVRLKNKASVLQPDKRCLVVVWTLAVKWGGFSPEGVDSSVGTLQGSRAVRQKITGKVIFFSTSANNSDKRNSVGCHTAALFVFSPPFHSFQTTTKSKQCESSMSSLQPQMHNVELCVSLPAARIWMAKSERWCPTALCPSPLWSSPSSAPTVSSTYSVSSDRPD